VDLGLAAALGWAAFVVISPFVAPALVHAVFYDDRPAMVLWDIRVIDSRLSPGMSFRYEFQYNKRRECFPPLGKGEVSYRLWYQDADGAFSRFKQLDSSVSFAVPATNAHRSTTVPVPTLAPGSYAMQYRAHFQCQGASAVQELDGPLMRFEVVAGS